MILIGQDTHGAWAWMILDRSNQLVTSGDGLPDRAMAAEVSLAVYRGAVKRCEADLDPAPIIAFPDEDVRA